MKITSDDAWVRALQSVADRGRSMMKEVCVHTHFSSEYEMTEWTCNAMQRLTEMGIKVRNQSVLLRGVNDSFDCMYRTIKKLSYLNIQPYLVFLHDMVPGCEHLRTTLATAERLFKELLGTTAGFNAPRFVCDTLGGGGKRQISGYEHYDHEIGVSAWVAPRVKPGRVFHHYDPIDQLPESGQAVWANPEERMRRLAEFEQEVQAILTYRGWDVATGNAVGAGESYVVQ
jgi:lysine 2,3-aminomutase